MTETVLVGVDGSEEGQVALDWATDEARRRDCELHLLHSAWVPMMQPVFVGYEHILHDSAQGILAEAEQRVRRTEPQRRLRTTLVYEDATTALVRASAEASLVVVGLRGRGGFPGLKIGSVAYQVAAHARVPVAVVGTEQPPPLDPPEVVVGLDDSPHGNAALRAGFTEAQRRGAVLRAVQAVRLPRGLGVEATLISPPELERRRVEFERFSETLLKENRSAFPDVRVVVDVQWDDATHALARASMRAALLIVGARGRRGFPRMALGSVAHGVLHYARCPVLVVHVAEPSQESAEP